ncbi:SdrD B-like domain-containing protein [Microbacterium sp. 1.5R]|uniref:SdrD B-like domain-containing protein n=1 Tax=Microbacterium sp. 1.5R TaxID=1916917 RepID=UPI0011A132E3|nr:SdrD B-like domain-containing protein [Microbacterium sp. 1.5R]
MDSSHADSARPTVRSTSRAIARPWRAVLAAVVTAVTVGASIVVASPAVAADGTVTGVVYQDFNDSGTRDAAAGDFGGDTGVGGVQVTATDSTGAVRGTATTSATGAYTLTVTGAATTDVRVEFTALPTAFRAARSGAGNGSTVQFVSIGATGVDLGVTQEGMVQTTAGAPRVVVPSQRSMIAYAGGDDVEGPTPNVPDQPALFGTTYDSSGDPASGRQVLATQGQIGTTWGTANYGDRHVFSGASFRRGTMVGPQGLGAIYLTDATTGSPNATPFVTIPNAGTNPRPADLTGYDWLHDTAGFSAPGRIGLGDIEISEDRRTLYAVNLNDRRLYAVPLTPGATPGAAPVAGTPQAITIPLATAAGCANAAVRPYGLGTFRGTLYVTLTCTGPTANDLRAWVVPMNEDTRAFGAAVLNVPLTFTRGPKYTATFPATSRTNNYLPWVETFQPLGEDGYGRGPSPIASSVVFDAAGNMSLSIKDRSADQNGIALSSTTPSDTEIYVYIGVGDLLRACRNAAGTWVTENAGSCGGNTSTQPANNWGIGGSKFYETVFYTTADMRSYHGSTAMGSALQLPGYTNVMATVIDPLALRQDGLRVYGNDDGRVERSATLTRASDRDGSFAKAGGLGDLSALVAEAPVEIGNRVWLDSDRDGVQDAGEAPIAGTTVRLYSADGSVIATAVTDADGEYYFSSSPGTSSPSAQYGLPLTADTGYEIRLDNAADYGAGGPLEHLAPTVTAAGADRAVDSNGVRQSPVLVSAAARTPDAGAADHTFDFGFVPLLSLGNRLWYDTGTGAGETDNGRHDAGEPPIVGATIELLDAAGAPVLGVDGAPRTTVTDAAGYYRFDDLLAATYRVRVAAGNFGAGAPLSGWTSSTGASAAFDAGSNNADKGVDAPNPSATGVTSGPIALAPGVIGDVDPGATGAGAHGPGGDATDNLTVDFSFVPQIDLTIDKQLTSGNGPYRLGDEVTFDLLASNNGPGAARPGFTVTDRLPTGLELVSATGDSWSAATVVGRDVILEWEGGTLAAGDDAEPITVTARVTSVDAGSLRNVAVVEPSPDEPIGESIPVGSTPDEFENGNPVPDPENPSNNDDGADIPVLPPTLSLGNRLWLDTGDGDDLDNGRFDDGEQPVADAVVELLGADGAPVLDAAGDPVVATTDAAGFYRFDDLSPGQYRVRVAAGSFTAAGPLAHHLSSTGSSAAFDAGSNNADKGEDARFPAETGVTSAVIDLQPGVTGELDGGATGAGANGPFGDQYDNLTADFGFIPALSLGNRLWFDDGTGAGQADNGILDDGERPVSGAVVELLDGTGAPVLTSDGAPLVATTDAAGFYRFDDLPAGDYRVRIAASNFATGAPLDGYFSSSPTSTDFDGASNNADKGANAPDPATTGVVSSTVTLAPGAQPADDVDAGASGAGAHGPGGDATDNLTVDFGFIERLAVGDFVWFDSDRDGIQDAGERPVPDVTVTLLNADGTPAVHGDGNPVPPVTTDANGHYVFDGLVPGDYRVRFSGFPSGYAPTKASSDGSTSANDSNPDATGLTPVFTLAVGSDTRPVTPADGATVARRINPTIDAGLVAAMSLGNRLWFDTGAGARTNNGSVDADEDPVAGAVIELLNPAGRPVLDNDGDPITTTTDAEGFYRFDGLTPGQYRVRVAAAAFADDGPLAGYVSSTVTSGAFDAPSNSADKGVDSLDPATTGVSSAVIDLQPGVTGEVDDDAEGAGDNSPFGDAFDNLTVDFGFVQPYDLTVSKQLTSKSTPYQVSQTVTYSLTPSNTGPGTAVSGFTVSDLLPDGLTFVSATGAGWQLVDAAGPEIVLRWTGRSLAAGDSATPITVTATVSTETPGTLVNFAVVEPSPDQRTPESIPVGSGPDKYENGDPAPTAGSPSNNDDGTPIVVAGPTYSLGNRLWEDTGAGPLTDNGRYDTGEDPVVGARVELLNAAGNVIATTSTDSSGFYRFDDLAPGDYRVRVAAVNFAADGPLASWLSSTAASADFGTPSNNSDKGEDSLAPATTGITSSVVALGASDSPSGEVDAGARGAGANGPLGDAFDTLTVDFGFIPGLSLGNRLWFDAGSGEGEANNGVFDDGEAPVVGAVVELLDGTGAPLLVGGVPVTTTTDAKGYYRFDGLPVGDYRVRVAASNFTPGAPLADWLSSSPTSVDATENNADKGQNAPDPAITGITSGVVTLTRANPTGDGDAGATGAGRHGPNGDAADLLTVDFGFTQAFAVGDTVWLDDDGDGRLDTDEPRVPNVLVTLLSADGNPVTDLDGAPVAPVRTDANGRYVFDNLPPGAYTVSFTEIPAGVQFTRQGAGDELGDSNPGRDGMTPVFVLGPAGDRTTPVEAGDGQITATRIDRTIDAGLVPLLAIGDYVWIDQDRDGRQDAGEAPVPGVTVTLLTADGTPAVDADGAPVAPTTTDAAGHYVFDALLPGDYRVRFTDLPAGYRPTRQSAAGTTSADDSNPDVTGLTPVFTLRGNGTNVRPVAPGDGITRAQQINPTIDAGIATQLYAIGDVVWFDTNANGHLDPGEQPVPGVLVSLRDADGSPARDWRGGVVPDQRTNANGQYLFDGLVAGDYYIQFSDIPAGYTFTAHGSGGDGDSNPLASGRTPVFSLGADSADLRLVSGADGTLLASFINSTIDAGLVTILPTTGSAVPVWAIILGVLLLLLGLGLTGARRRRAH